MNQTNLWFNIQAIVTRLTLGTNKMYKYVKHTKKFYETNFSLVPIQRELCTDNFYGVVIIIVDKEF